MSSHALFKVICYSLRASWPVSFNSCCTTCGCEVKGLWEVAARYLEVIYARAILGTQVSMYEGASPLR